MNSIFSKSSEAGKNYIKGKYGVEVPEATSLDSCVDSLFSIYDKVCGEFNPPFVSKNINTAIRSIKESLKGQQSIIAMHPEDYVLVHIGAFSKATGVLVDCDGVSYELSNMFTKLDNDRKENDEVQK